MKVILTYEKYGNIRNQYQAQFIYESTDEIKELESIVKKYKNEILIQYANNKIKNTNTINKINIPKEILQEFLNSILSLKNTTIIVNDKNFNHTNTKDIEDIIDSLHINITLKKGKYFNLEDVYYITFKYANDSQREQIAYDFNINLNSIIGTNPNTNNTNYLFPFIVDRNGTITFQNTGIIGGTNIPEETLPFFIKRFICEYNAVIKINNIKFRELTNINDLLQAISSLNQGKTRKREINNK